MGGLSVPSVPLWWKKSNHHRGTESTETSPPLFVRRDHHRHAVSLDVGMRILGRAELLDFHQKAVQDGPAELHMRHLATAKANGRLHFVAMLQEPDDVVFLEIEIVLVNTRAE